MQPPQLPEQWPANCPAKLSPALQRALDPQPEQRFTSVTDFVAVVNTAEDMGTAFASNNIQSGSQVEKAQNTNNPADSQEAPKPEKRKPIQQRVRSRKKDTDKSAKANKSPKHTLPKPRKSGVQSPYWPTLLWITLGWTPIILLFMDSFGWIYICTSCDLFLSVLYHAIAVGLGWTITSLAIKNQYQLMPKHIVRLLLLGIGSGIIGGLTHYWADEGILIAMIVELTVGGIVSGFILRKQMHLTKWQIAMLGGGWMLSLPYPGLIGGAIMIAILEAARKRAARQTETN